MSAREDGERLTNTEKLENLIKARGIKKKHLAERLGLSPYGLALKIKGESEFKSREIVGLCNELEITEPAEICDIFFGSK